MEYQSMLDHAKAIRDYCKSTICDKCVFEYANECQIQRTPCSWCLEMKLLKCPFCGSDKIKIVEKAECCFYVLCTRCLSQSTPCVTKNKALEAWNRRIDK